MQWQANNSLFTSSEPLHTVSHTSIIIIPSAFKYCYLKNSKLEQFNVSKPALCKLIYYLSFAQWCIAPVKVIIRSVCSARLLHTGRWLMRLVHLLRTNSGRSCPRLSITEIIRGQWSGRSVQSASTLILYRSLSPPSETIYSSVVIQPSPDRITPVLQSEQGSKHSTLFSRYTINVSSFACLCLNMWAS